MSRIIRITEEQERKLIGSILNESQVYPVEPGKVLIAKEFLDKNFEKSYYTKKNDDGVVVNQTVVMPKAPNGEIFGKDAKDSVSLKNVFIQLEDYCKDMFADKVQRTKFLRQVIKDWLAGRITSQGMLSVNKY